MKNAIPKLLKQIDEMLGKKAQNMDNPTIDQDLGYLIFLATAYRYSQQEEYKEKAYALTEKLLEVFPEKELNMSLYEGFDGVAWTIDYLQRCNVLGSDDILSDFIPHLISSIEIDLSNNHYDVLYGFVGKLQYFINSGQYNSPEIRELFEGAIDSLDRSSVENEDGLYWCETEAIKTINLGYAHGLPNILVFLTRLHTLGFENPKIIKMIRGIVKTILSQKNKPLGISVYGSGYSLEHEVNSFSRLAWCYGDLGICYAFLYSGKMLQNEDWINEALFIKDRIVSRGISESGLTHFDDYSFFDSAFCHGISGISYFLYKINELIGGDAMVEKKLAYWNKELIKNLEIQLAIDDTIYYPYQPSTGDEVYTLDKEMMLNGVCGTGLVLLSLQYDKADWADLFLIY